MGIDKKDIDKIKSLKKRIYELLDSNEYFKAQTLLLRGLRSFEKSNTKNYFLLAELAGSFITLGSESNNEIMVNQGLRLFYENEENLKTYITKSSFNYCVANGLHALYKLTIQNTPYKTPKPENIESHLLEAKAAYIRAFKDIDLKNLDFLSIQILTNLGNNLNHQGRIVESLQLFDTVLKHSPEFPASIASKADCLIYMIRTTECEWTISLFLQIYSLNSKAIQNHIPIEEVRQGIKLGLKRSKEVLEQANFDFNTIPQEIYQNEIEYQNHSKKVRFYLDNFFSLSEHALYCKCLQSKSDNLMIGYKGLITTNQKLVKLELLVNQLKSEFALSRALFYEYLYGNNIDSVHFELFSSATINGLKIEKLRTSFRQCFGIFDKIAWGICYLFDIEINKGENIYFEGFWKNQRGPKDRWIKINQIENLHLTALYSISTDLERTSGEFRFYKDWRNILEHGALFITHKQEEVKEDEFATIIFEKDFYTKTKHVLQLTRSAIFSFVFCVRKELIEKN